MSEKRFNEFWKFWVRTHPSDKSLEGLVRVFWERQQSAINDLQSENEQLSKLVERMATDSNNLIEEYSKFNATAYKYGRIKTYSDIYDKTLEAYEAFKKGKDKL